MIIDNKPLDARTSHVECVYKNTLQISKGSGKYLTETPLPKKVSYEKSYRVPEDKDADTIARNTRKFDKYYEHVATDMKDLKKNTDVRASINDKVVPSNRGQSVDRFHYLHDDLQDHVVEDFNKNVSSREIEKNAFYRNQ